MAKAPATTPDREAIRSSAEFRAFVESQSIEAQRRRDDWKGAIVARTTAKARAISDHEGQIMAFDNDISDLTAAVADEQAIIDAAARALSIETRSPKLTAVPNVVREEQS